MANDRVIKTTIELAGEGSYQAKLNQIGKALRNVNSQQKVVGAQFDRNDKSLAALTARMSVYQDRLTLQQAKLKAIGEEYERVIQKEGENSETARKLANEYNYASAQLYKTERAISELEGAMQGAARESRNWLKITEEQKKALVQLGKEAEQAAGKMSKALTAATVGAVTYSAKEYMGFGRAMSDVATLADETAVSLDKLSSQALAASNATGVAATEIAQGAYMALSSGIDTANAMEYITEASKAAKAGQSDLNTVVDGSTSIMNAWRISSSQATSVFEKLLVAQDKGKTTVGQISAQIGQITGLAPQLNMSLDETLASVAALTKNGVQTSSAITGLRAVLSNVLKPTKEATEAAAALGLEFNAAALQSKGLTGFLADVQQKTGGSSEELAKLFGSVEGLSQVMLLGGSAAGDYADALEAMQNSTGKLDKAFQTVTNNSAEKLNMSLNKLRNNAIQFGQTLSPYIDLASDSLGRLSEKIAALSEDEQKSILQTALWTAAGLKAVSMLSKITATIKLMGAAAGPVGLTAVAIAGLVGTIAAVNNAIESTSLDAAWERFSEKANANVSGEMNAIITANVDTTQAETEMTTAITGVYGKVASALTDGKADTPAVVEQLKTDISSLFATAKDNLTGLGPEAEGYATELKTLEEQTTAWVNSMAGKSTKYVLQHLGELEELEGKVQEVVAEIDAAKNSVRNQNIGAYEMTVAGATTDQETIAKGVSWAYQNREQDLQEIYARGAADKAAANQAYLDGVLSEEEHLEAEKRIEGRIKGEVAAAERVYADRFSALLRGATEAFATVDPESARIITNFVDAPKIKEEIDKELQTVMDGIDYGTMDLNAAQQKVQGIYDRVFGVGHTDVLPIDAQHYAQLLQASLNTVVGQTLDGVSFEDKGLMDTIMEILNSDAGKPLNVDTSNLRETLTTAYGEIEKTVEQEKAQVAEKIGETTGGTDGQAEKFVDSVEQSIITATANKQANESTAMEIATKIADKQKIVDALQEVINGWDAGEIDPAEAHSKVQSIYDQIFGEGYADFVPANTGQMASALVETLKADIAGMQEELRGMLGSVGTAGTEGLALSLGDPEGTVQAAIRGTMRGTVDASKDEIDSHSPSRVFYGIGQDAIQGLINGAASKQSAVAAKFAAIARAAANAARKELQINSPSKVFETIGGYTADGLIYGIEKKIDAVERTMKRMVNPKGIRTTTPETTVRTAQESRQTVVNVTYSGAFTRREAQRFGRELVMQLETERTGRGG